MEITKLRSPRPRLGLQNLKPWDFPATGLLRPPPVYQQKLGNLEDLLMARRSRREFTVPLTIQQLGDLLWHSYRLRKKTCLKDDVFWESRPSPAGGGCYPIQVLAFSVRTLSKTLLAYNPEYHVFGVLALTRGKIFDRAVEDVEKCLKIGNGTVLWFVADMSRSLSRYRDPESLAWRDSGALLATASLVAEGMGLNFCGLGLHDIPALRRFLKLEDWTMGVGGCVISGASPTNLTKR